MRLDPIRVRYIKDGIETVLSFPAGVDWAEVCNHIQAKLFPDVTEAEKIADRARADEILRRHAAKSKGVR